MAVGIEQNWKPYESSQTVPAYSLARITGTSNKGGRIVYEIAQSDGSDSASYCATGDVDSKKGIVNLGPVFNVKYTGSLAAGDRCEPASGSWAVSKSSSGKFVCIGIADSDKEIATIQQDQAKGNLKMFTAPSGGIPGRVGTTMGSATCNVIETNSSGELTPSGSTITVYNWARFPACKNGDRYGVAGWINAAWCVIAEDCTDEGSTISPMSVTASESSPSELISFNTIDPMQMWAYSGYVAPTTPTGGTGGGIE